MMDRFRPEDCEIDRVIDRHGIHVVGGPLLVGGVNFLAERTCLFSDYYVRDILTDKKRFRAYLKFREQAFEIAVTELMSASKSPVDMFLSIAADRKHFQHDFMNYIMLCHTRNDGTSSIWQQSINHDAGSNGLKFVNSSIKHYLPKDAIQEFEEEQKFLHQQLCATHRYFAYRKLLVRLDFIQLDSDPEDVLKRLKSSTAWSGLPDYELMRCLKSHIDFLKEYEKSKVDPASSKSEYENAALEKINSELSSQLDKHADNYDRMLMGQYYDRMKVRGLARECAAQAQLTGVILVGEAVPIREHVKKHILSTNPEVKKSPVLQEVKQLLNQEIKGYIGQLKEKLRSGPARGRRWPLLVLGLASLTAMVKPNR